MNLTATEAENHLDSIERPDESMRSEVNESIQERREHFNEKYKDWIAWQNELVARYGIFGEEYRPW